MHATNGNAEAMGKLFTSQEALTAAISLTKGEMKGFLSDLDGMQHAAGKTDAAFQEMSKSTTAQFKRMQSNLSALGITVGSELLPRVNQAITGINGLVTAFTKLPKDEQQRWINMATGLGEATVALYAITKGIQGMTAAIVAMRNVYGGLVALVGGTAASLLVFGTAAAVGTAASKNLEQANRDAGIGYDVLIKKANDASPAMQQVATATAAVTDAMAAQNPKIDETRKQIADLTKQRQELLITLEHAPTTTDPLGLAGIIDPEADAKRKAALAGIEQQISALAESLSAMTHPAEQVATAINNTGSAFQSATEAATPYGRVIQEAAAAVAALATESGPPLTALTNTGSAFQTAAQAAVPFSQAMTDAGAAVASFGTFAQPTMDALNALNTELQKAVEQGGTVFSALIESVATGYDQLAQTTAEHEDKIAALVQERAEAKTRAARQGVDDRIAAENEGYSNELAAQIVAQGEQLAAQRQHLGEMLIAQVETMTQMGFVSQERAAALVAGISKEYGVLPNLAATSFGAMQASIDQWAGDASISAESVIAKLHLTGAEADSTRQLMEQMAKKYEAELVENFKDGKIDAEQLKVAIAAIPSRVESLLSTNWASELAQIRAIGGAMGSLPTSKLIRIEAGIDPEFRHKSPSPIEREMALIDEFAGRDHIFKLGTTGNVDGLASYAWRERPA
jgi:hypothetical protein